MIISGYRRDVDGLRAVAVLAVLVYHFTPTYLPAGFLGVDVFFVISGFVIGQGLIREVSATGRLSFRSFYFRRLRRLAPAFSLVLLSALVATFFSISIWNHSPVILSALAAIFGASNFWFMFQDSYDAQQGAVEPFLHTWSLGVEEQFYFVAPVMIFLLWRTGREKFRSRLSALVLLLLLSGLLLAQVLNQTMAFYFPLTRFWEIGFGVLVASFLARPARPSFRGSVNNLLSLMAAGIVIVSLFRMSDLESGPAIGSIIPVAAASSLIYFGERTIIGRFLALSPFVYIGKISYPLYLWHFPVLVFWPIWFGELTFGGVLFPLLISLMLAIGTFHLLEMPISDGQMSRRMWLSVTASFLAGATVLASLSLLRVSDLPNYGGSHLPEGPVPSLATEPLEYVIVIGDSHARTMGPLRDQVEAVGLGFASWTTTGCPWLLGVDRRDFAEGIGLGECDAALQLERLQWVQSFPPSTVVLVARWPAAVEAKVVEKPEWSKGFAFAGLSEQLTDLEFAGVLEETVNSIEQAGHRVVLVYPWPDIGYSVPEAVLEANSWPLEKAISIPSSEWRERSARTQKILDSVQGQRITRINPDAVFCDFSASGRCETHSASQIFYEDDDHLSSSGASLVAAEIMKAIKATVSR